VPVGALLAPLAAEAIIPALGGADALGALGVGGLTAGLGGLFGAGTGSLFSEITGGDPGKGALSGAIGGAAAPLGGAAGEALGIGSTAGSLVGGAAGGLLGAEVTGGNPLIGGIEGAAGPALGAATGISAPAEPATGSPAATGGGAPGITGGLPNDPILGGDAFLNQSGTGNASFLGATGAGGGSISGPTAGGPTTGGTAGSTSMAGDPFGGSDYSSGGLSAGSDFTNKLGSLLSDPKTLLGIAPLIMGMMQGNQSAGTENQLTQLAGQSRNQSAALQAPLQTGILPPGAKQAIDAATASSKAAAKSNFASLGLSGSTMEAQQMQAIDRNAAAQSFSFADKLFSQGLDAMNISAGADRALLSAQLQRDQELQNAILAASRGLGGGSSGT
jgi:hypothetical protein